MCACVSVDAVSADAPLVYIVQLSVGGLSGTLGVSYLLLYAYCTTVLCRQCCYLCGQLNYPVMPKSQTVISTVIRGRGSSREVSKQLCPIIILEVATSGVQ